MDKNTLRFIHLPADTTDPKHITKRLGKPGAYKEVTIIKKKKMRIYLKEGFQYGPRFRASGKKSVRCHDVFQTDLTIGKDGYDCENESCERCVRGGLKQFFFHRKGTKDRYSDVWSKLAYDTFIAHYRSESPQLFETPITYDSKKDRFSRRESWSEDHCDEPNLIVVMPEKDIKDEYV
jgi:hypothetical protein